MEAWAEKALCSKHWNGVGFSNCLHSQISWLLRYGSSVSYLMAKQLQTRTVWRHWVPWLAQPSKNLHSSQVSLILSQVSWNILYHFVGWATWATDFSPLWYRFLQCSRFWYRDSRASAFALGFFLGICSWSCKQRWQWFRAIGKPARRQAWWPRRVGTEWLAVSIFHICSSLQPTSSLSLKMRIHITASEALWFMCRDIVMAAVRSSGCALRHPKSHHTLSPWINMKSIWSRICSFGLSLCRISLIGHAGK